MVIMVVKVGECDMGFVVGVEKFVGVGLLSGNIVKKGSGEWEFFGCYGVVVLVDG